MAFTDLSMGYLAEVCRTPIVAHDPTTGSFDENLRKNYQLEAVAELRH